jgi:hypothetical protein
MEKNPGRVSSSGDRRAESTDKLVIVVAIGPALAYRHDAHRIET